jgi:hypothetical protein
MISKGRFEMTWNVRHHGPDGVYLKCYVFDHEAEARRFYAEKDAPPMHKLSLWTGGAEVHNLVFGVRHAFDYWRCVAEKEGAEEFP